MMGGASGEFIGSVIDLYDWTPYKPGDKIVDIGAELDISRHGS